MQAVTGAIGSLLPKLVELLMEEYNLQKGTKKGVESLVREMKTMHAALCKVAEMPRDQLDEQVKLWADEVRDLSYDIEDAIDKFLVRVDGSNKPAADGNKLTVLMKMMSNLFIKGIDSRQIATAIKDINKEVVEVANRRGRYTVDNIVPKPIAGTTIDPRLRALYTEVTELVGIYGKRDQELVKLLSLGDEVATKKKLKIVSVVGFGGLGKTTLVRTVYDKIKGGFDSWAFVPVGRNPDLKKIFRDILIGLDKEKYSNINLIVLDERQLIEELREFLQDKRYLVIIDDIWDEKVWGDIKLAFSNMNNLGSRLITTTRILSVSKACCPSTHDSVYQMEPLSDNDSSRLFYKRIFSSENGCPSELEKISRDILKKCGGVPLAILTVGGLLTTGQGIKAKVEWHVLLNSIGRGLTEAASVEEMQRILSFSYYDLPSDLKTCLLYISMYPEDHEINKEELIWKWICENFVQHGKQGTSIFEVGETYFNELINRNLILPIYNGFCEVESCRVHDMVLDLIRSLSGEAKFVTVLDGYYKDITCSQVNIRRISLQSSKEDHQTKALLNSMSVSQVRSITVFSPAMTIMPAIRSFGVLRVLDLSGCDLGAVTCQRNLSDVVYLFHLRYLGLRETDICELPMDIRNLQFLQVLDVGSNYGLRVLPSSMWKLGKLMVVKGVCNWPPGILGNLTSLEVLDRIYVSLSSVQELGNLGRLRELVIHFFSWSPELEEAFVESICNLHDIQSLTIYYHVCSSYYRLLGECWVPPRCLRKFVLKSDEVPCPTLPMWIIRCGPSHLSNISEFSMKMKEVRQEDVLILGTLPALLRLSVWSNNQTERLLLINSDGFRCVVYFQLCCRPATQVVFQHGALPNAEVVRFNLGVRVAKEDGNGDLFELGLGNLLSLQKALIEIHWDEVTVKEANEAECAVRDALNAHPNHPRIKMCLEPDPEDTDDEDDDEYYDDDDDYYDDDDDSDNGGERMDLD